MWRPRTFLSCVLICGGAVLLFLGARDYVGSRLGQAEAANQFEQTISHSAPAPGSFHAARLPEPAPLPLQPGEAFAKLIIPRLHTDLYVIEGTGKRQLRHGPGHMTGSALPGKTGNCIIAGHRDTHFRVLKNIRKGDDIVLETQRGTFLYRVDNLEVVSPKNTKVLQPAPDARLSLITCYPFYYVGAAPRRFAVQANLAGAIRNAPVSGE
ncbi:MAG TPA: class D sortase [Bryobacteraceae bacterium]|nr:class D sortase [Bryobacteraceae bacterium]